MKKTLIAGLGAFALVATSLLLVTTTGQTASAAATAPTAWANSHKYHGDDEYHWVTDPDAVPADPDGEDGFDNPANLTQIGDRVPGTRQETTTTEVTRYRYLRYTRANEAPSYPPGPDGGNGWRAYGVVDTVPGALTPDTIHLDPDHPGYNNYVFFWSFTDQVETVETVDVYTWWVQTRDAWTDVDGGDPGNGDKGDGTVPERPGKPGTTAPGGGRPGQGQGQAGQAGQGDADVDVPIEIDAGL